MTTIQRNLNGIIYQLTVKEEERMMMEEEEGEVALQEPTVADVGLDETGPTGLEALSVKVMVSSLNETLSNVKYKKTLKVVTLEVKVGEERGVLLQRWQHQGGEGEQPQVQFCLGKNWIFRGGGNDTDFLY